MQPPPPVVPRPRTVLKRIATAPATAPAPAPLDSYTSTFTGRQFWPLDPRPEDVDIRDIARALSMQCRWGGHVRIFYSVAQHCVSVARHCPVSPVRALLHDAAEAYLVDVPTPIKKYLHGYGDIEMHLLKVIGQRFGIDGLDVMPGAVHEQDGRALATEHRDLRTQLSFWRPPAVAWPEALIALTPYEAEAQFLALAADLGLR